MKRNCVVCEKEIDIEKEEYFDGESLNEYWCYNCGEAEIIKQ